MKNCILVLFLHLSISISGVYANNLEKIQSLINKAQNDLYSDPDQASYNASEAIRLCTENEATKDLKVQAMLLYSRAEQLLGNFDSSIKNLYDAQHIVSPTNKLRVAQIQSLMARIYGKLGDYEKAINLNEQATAIFKAIGDSAGVAECYNERGVMHYSINEFQAAETFLQKALTINRSLKNLRCIAMNLNNMCLYQGDANKKLKMIAEAIAINKNLDSQWALGENYNNMGKQYYYDKQYDKALEALKKGYECAYKIGAQELICDFYEYSSWVYAAIGDYKNAYTQQYQMYSLSRRLQSSYKLRNIEQEIAYQNMSNQKHETELQKQAYEIKLLKRNIWLIGSVLILGFAACIFLYKWYKHKKNLQLIETKYKLEQSERELSQLKLQQQEMELKNIQNKLDTNRQEITNFAVFLQSRNELLDKIKEMVKEGFKMDNQTILPHLKKINAFISQYQNGDKISNSILLSIEEKNKEFIMRLNEKHPNLTQGEKHLATLLRVNLSAKEISMLTGTTPKTINMNRYRLRKALNLSSDEDLVGYLQSF